MQCIQRVFGCVESHYSVPVLHQVPTLHNISWRTYDLLQDNAILMYTVWLGRFSVMERALTIKASVCPAQGVVFTITGVAQQENTNERVLFSVMSC